MSMVTIPGGSFNSEGHLYRGAQGQEVLSVTQVFQMLGLVNYDGVRAEVLARKSQLGIAVHKAVEFLAEGVLNWDTVDATAMPYVVAADEWMRAMHFESLDREQQGIHVANGMVYGFQYDHRGRMLFKGWMRNVLLDLKTCDKASPTWALQTAAYALAAPSLPRGQHYLRVVLQLKPDCTMTPYYYDDLNDESTFLYMLYCAIWKMNHGLGKLELVL